MSTDSTNMDRRSFLKASALAGGGLMIGFNWFAGCQPSGPAPMKGPPDSWFDINAFLKIGNNGLVTIMSPNPEIGQNVKTSMPMIVADELDVDWRDVVVEQAGLDTDKYTRQLAGGSQSIRQGWEGLRTAGAAARQMLKDAAAQRWNVSASELTTEDGTIRHEANGQEVGYGDVASEAAKMPVPEDVELKNPDDFDIIGTSRKNVDAREIVTGQPLFGMDTEREGMQIAMIKHPPAFGMTISSVDASEAKGMPGVEDVFTIDAAPPEDSRQWSDVNAFPELVVVTGRSTWEVMQAKEAVNVEWEQDSPPESTADHTRELERLLNEGQVEPSRRDGNPEAAFERAERVIERTYSAPFLAHNTMAPMNFFADATGDRAELLGPIQTPEYLRPSVAGLLDLPEDKVHIQMTRMGGGFGRRLYGNFGAEAAAISQKADAPVKLVYTREDDMTQGTYRPAYRVKYRAALDADDNLIGFHVRGAGVNESPVFADRYPAGAVENYLAEDLVLDSNVTTGAWRAPRSNFIAGAEQSFLDEVAEIAGKDPIDFRLELFDRAINDPVGDEHDYEAERYAGVLELVREKSNWDETPSDVSRGVSAYYSHNSYVAQVVELTLDGDTPRIDKVWCGVDCGIVVNPDAARNQVEGSVIDGIGHALYSKLTLTDGEPDQNNFDDYRMIRMPEAPKSIETHFVDNGIDPTGLGEPGLPPISAALANALYQSTGERLYEQPFIDGLKEDELAATG
ncbi:isoquinoline 1-oxidoreductase [Salinibacter sp. 10B]|uniref:xanthine dehydrogenase family protein molybdopterin-binding subunit n=1 Tax=Salinibacter sp. 10B TaxID=1923971 RepID=UPI000CF50CD5|nr:molybdopterin cofactor-binding domain-containing protein [Salinibacter sp. 10B]PQJ26977.1 isoquinoline 1-oxidoreductase [Salinibacter sp. 10B]